MNFVRGFAVVFVAVYVSIQDPAYGAALYRRQDLNTDSYLDSSRGQSADFETRPKLSLNDVGFDMESDEPLRLKESRNKLTAEEIIRQARRERSRVLLGNAAARRPSLAADVDDDDDEEVGTRAQTRYGARYGNRDATSGEDVGNARLRSNTSPDQDYDDVDNDAGSARNTGYDRFDNRRAEKQSPEAVRGAYKNKELKNKLGNVNGQSAQSEELENYDLKTLKSIINNLRSEKLNFDKISKVIGEESRVSSFVQERPETKVRTNPGGVPRPANKPQGNLNLEDYLITRNNGLKSRNAEQGPVRTESGIAAKEHVMRLLREMEKLEELRNLQRALETEDDTAEYYELKQELADDVKNVRMKVRDAIKQLQ